MFNPSKNKQNAVAVPSKLIGMLALGAGAAVVVMKALDRVRKQVHTRVKLTWRLSEEDQHAVARMEGEGGPSLPAPVAPPPS